MALTSGTRLGPYEISGAIGAGGMGEVYRATDTRLGREVAVKVLPAGFAQEADRLARFEREAKVIAALNHPNICQIYDIGPNYLVMEYIDGAVPCAPLAPADAIRLALGITAALGAAHSKGITHRDLKPANVLVTKSGIKLLDFGLARVDNYEGAGDAETHSALSMAGAVMGTVAYMSPEQAQGKRADARSDIFSLGLLLYELLSGRQAFVGESATDTMAAIIRDEPTPLRSPLGNVPAGLIDVVMRCLRKAPAARFQTAIEIEAALEALTAVRVDEPPSIAVLPFLNMSADKENEYFGDGLAEEIINALTRVPGLRVIARTSAFAFKDKQEDVRRIAEMLGVRNMLEGSVRKAAGRIRVTAQLITAADGSHLWSARYDREMTDVFAVQDEIAHAVVDALKSYLGPPMPRRAAKRPVDVEAYHLYVKGLHYIHKLTPEGTEAGARLFEQALAVDPHFALPLATLANAQFIRIMTGTAPASEAAPLGIQFAERALALDDSLGEAVGVRALLWALYQHRWHDALKEFERAIALNPASALTPHYYAVVLTGLNRLAEAETWQREAIKGDPFRPVGHFFMARVLVSMRRFEDATEHARREIEVAPDYWTGHAALGLALLRSGDPPRAVRAMEAVLSPLGHYATGWRGCAYILAGQPERAVRLLEELRTAAEGRYVSAFPSAMIHAELGDIAAAFECLEKSFSERDFELYNLLTETSFDKMRSEPAYTDLLRRMNLG